MEVMVAMSRKGRNFYYNVEDVKNFSRDVDLSVKDLKKTRFKGPGNTPTTMIKQAKRVNGKVSYGDMLKLVHRYGKPIFEEDYKSKMYSLDWKTRPSLQTHYGTIGKSKKSEKIYDGSYIVSFRRDKNEMEIVKRV